MNKLKIFIPVLLMVLSTTIQAGINLPVKRNVYIISVGVNEYSKSDYRLRFQNCANDARAFSNHLRQDIEKKKIQAEATRSLIRPIGSYYYSTIDSVFDYTLLEEQASLANIQSAFLEVIEKAGPNDYFFFFFAGITRETAPNQTVLIPHLEYDFVEDSFNMADLIDMAELSAFMEQVQCYNQMVISESGVGAQFAKNLIGHLFESNPHVAQHYERNRMIITTKGLGLDVHYCDGKRIGHGPLMSYILASEDILLAFGDPDGYEFQLNKQEVVCSVRDRRYFAFYQEKKYREFLLQNQLNPGTRGGKASKIGDAPLDSADYNPVKTYAFIVATNEYESAETWDKLKNPINDAEKISELLKSKYDVEVSILKDMERDAIMDSMEIIQEQLDSNDRFIFFVAGHGYYKHKTRSGYLVFKNSLSLSDDPSLRHSYLHMATLQHMLNYMPCKQVLAIFDVCFGAQFDPAGKDLHLNNYEELSLDHNLDTFINRKNQHMSRIFMASGKYEVPDYWNNSLDHSPFANKIIEVLEEEKQFTSPGKIFAKLEANATEPVLKWWGSHQPRGDFLLKVLH